MPSPFENQTKQFNVLINAEDQHSLWPQDYAVPAGWEPVSSGTLAECTAYVDAHWTDMRPRSLKLAQAAANGSRR
ncbi:MbtH family protein [Actinospica robiniae]|uniref:MbtH family protein n=1 Tax=Actinospica robiniae TaxID=304901 RepID=UPI00040F296E|nr:MbtH family NRPS accessory protein [Actinospica robiniae]